MDQSGQSFPPDTWIIFIISVFICAWVLIAFLIAKITAHLMPEFRRLNEIKLKIREIEKTEWFAKLPKDLQKEICSPDKWEETKDEETEDVPLVIWFINLPEDINKNIKRQLCLDIMKKIEEFKSWSDELLDALCDRVIPVFYPEYNRSRIPIIQRGSSIDKMLFCVNGKLRTYSFTTTTRGVDLRVDYLEDGMFCGEKLIHWYRANLDSVNLPISTKTIKTETKVDAFALMCDDLQYFFIKHRATLT